MSVTTSPHVWAKTYFKREDFHTDAMHFSSSLNEKWTNGNSFLCVLNGCFIEFTYQRKRSYSFYKLQHLAKHCTLSLHLTQSDKTTKVHILSWQLTLLGRLVYCRAPLPQAFYQVAITVYNNHLYVKVPLQLLFGLLCVNGCINATAYFSMALDIIISTI